MEVISGYKVGSTETALTKVVTETTPCACSPIGKVWKVSLPVAPTVTPVDSQKTIYEYDALGRTVKVTSPPENAGFSSYEYGGTTVKTIDPKGKWKKFENDSLGNLVKVTEPFPGPGTGADYVTTFAYSMFGKLTPPKGRNSSLSLGANPHDHAEPTHLHDPNHPAGNGGCRRVGSAPKLTEVVEGANPEACPLFRYSLKGFKSLILVRITHFQYRSPRASLQLLASV